MSEQARLLRQYGLRVTQARTCVLRLLQQEGSLPVAELGERLAQQGIWLGRPTLDGVLRRFGSVGLLARLEREAADRQVVGG